LAKPIFATKRGLETGGFIMFKAKSILIMTVVLLFPSACGEESEATKSGRLGKTADYGGADSIFLK
jgi:hypothetical protein